MIDVVLHFQKDLVALLPRRWSSGTVRRLLPGSASCKDVIEAVGVPHCELGRILAGTGPDQIEIAQETLLDHHTHLEIHSVPTRYLPEPRFLCDQHLGKLARLLRIMGFDTTWDANWLEPEIARKGPRQQRVILSGNRALLKRRQLTMAQLIRSADPDLQAGEVLHRWRLRDRIQLFGRCSTCGGLLQEVAKETVAERIPPLTARWLDTYYTCRECDHLFWEGTHVPALKERIETIIRNLP